MTVLRNGHGSTLICDACALHQDSDQSPTFSHYDAITFGGWTRGTPGNRGLRCPSCAGRPHDARLGHLNGSGS